MNQKSILNRIYLPIMCLVMALSVSLRLAAMLTDYDLRVGYFNEKKLISTASIIVVCGSILLFTYAFAGNKSEKLIATFTTPSTYVPSAVTITALIFFATKTYSRIKDSEFTYAGISKENAALHISQNLSFYVTAILVPLALLAAVYFILNATVAERYSVARAAFGVCAVLFFAIYASFLYFDTTLAINAPNKIVDQMAFIFASLFFLYEIRISLARECWHLYIAFGFVAATLGVYSSVPSIVMFFVKDTVISHSIEETLLTLCISMFIVSRLLLACKLNPDKESEFVTVMRENADERNRYIVEKEEIERRAYIELYNRLSEIEELSEDTNENELFGIQAEESDIEEAETQTVENGESEAATEPAESVEEAASTVSEKAAEEIPELETATEESKIEEAAEEAASEDKSPEETHEATEINEASEETEPSSEEPEADEAKETSADSQPSSEESEADEANGVSAEPEAPANNTAEE